MKYKKLVIPIYLFEDDLGRFLFHDVTVLVAPDSTATSSSFDQKHDDYSLSSHEIERMGRESAQRFLNEKYTSILRGKCTLTSKEVNGIRLFLGVNGSELAYLIGLNKGTVSRILNIKHDVQKESMLLLMEKMKNELDSPGITRATLEKLNGKVSTEIMELDFAPSVIAEWIIRKFVELEECITNLKLQKLLYYSQGIAAGRFGCRLISGDFEAWEHGPVIPSVYSSYKNAGCGALPTNPSENLSMLTRNTKAIQILNETINSYGKYTAWVLRDKTHCESPWLETKQNEVIEFKKIQTYFTNSL